MPPKRPSICRHHITIAAALFIGGCGGKAVIDAEETTDPGGGFAELSIDGATLGVDCKPIGSALSGTVSLVFGNFTKTDMFFPGGVRGQIASPGGAATTFDLFLAPTTVDAGDTFRTDVAVIANTEMGADTCTQCTDDLSVTVFANFVRGNSKGELGATSGDVGILCGL